MSFKAGIALLVLIVGVIIVATIYSTNQINPDQVEINLTSDTQPEEELGAIGAKISLVKHTEQGSIVFLSRHEFISKIEPGDKIYKSLVFLPDEKHIQQVVRRYYSEKYNISYEEVQNISLPSENYSFRLIEFDPYHGNLVLAKIWKPQHLFLISFFIILILEAVILNFIPG